MSKPVSALREGKLAFQILLAAFGCILQFVNSSSVIRKKFLFTVLPEDRTSFGVETASTFHAKYIDSQTPTDKLTQIMKFPLVSFILLAALLPSQSQETAVPQWDVEIPGPITAGTPSEPAPKPEPIDFTVLSSRTTRMLVTEAPEMNDLPPVSGMINVTVQVVEDPKLPDPPPPLPAMPPDDPAVVARMAELLETYRGTDLVFLSATVYDHNRTFLRIYPNGKVGNDVSAWSNLDFNHFSGFSTYRVKDAVDGTIYDFGLLMGIGNTNFQRMREVAERSGSGDMTPEIPELPDFSAGGPAFIVVEGDAASPAMDTLEQIHDLYRKEGPRMEQAYHAREEARAERKAYLLANSPKPEDIVIKFWERDPASGK